MPTGTHNYFQTAADSEKSLWDQQVDKLKKAAQDFAGLFDQLTGLKSVAAKDPALKAEYDSLMSRGAFVRAQVESVTRAIDSAIGTAKSLIGESALHGVAGRMGDMGLIPLVPVAVIAGAIAVVASWNSAAMVMRSRLQKAQLDAAQKAGASAEQLTQIVNAQNDSNQNIGFTGSIGQALAPLIKFGMIGIALYLLLPVLQDALRDKK